MCGIIGGVDRAGVSFGEELARAGCQRMAHRGPDAEGFTESQGVLIGNRRLAILDVESGNQPMYSDDGQIAVVQNGEIYNFKELSRGLNCKTNCDTEVILRLYERDGADFVNQLNGMFAIAIHDRREGRVLLYRDRAGQKPLYLYDDGQRLLFASEIKSLLAMGVRPEMDWEAFDTFLAFNYVPPPRTMFKGVRHLLPGHRLEIQNGVCHESCWWDLSVEQEEGVSTTEWTERILDVLQDAVRLRLRSDVPLGAFLSGGIDSSLIVKLMSEQLPHPVKTFCIGQDDDWFKDAEFAAKAAEVCGTDHHCEVAQSNLAETWPLSIYHNDQPHGDVSFLPTYLVSQLARQKLKVVLTGDGGDELFAGYESYQRFFSQSDPAASQEDFERRYYHSICLFKDQERTGIYSSEMKNRLRGFDSQECTQGRFEGLRHLDRINQVLGVDVKMLLPGNNLVKPDKMAMAVSLEARAPFMDYRLIETAFRIPGAFKLQGGETKSILKQAAVQKLPRDIIYRPKQMFTMPLGKWFRGPLLPFLREVLTSARSRERGVFEPGPVERLIQAHAAGTQDHTRQLRALLVMELWQRTYLDASFETAPTCTDLGIQNAPSSESRALVA